MKREQIIEILQKHKDKWIRWSGGYVSDENFDEVADAILALPLDVPSEDEVKKHMIEMNLYQHLDEFDNDVWDEGKLHWAIVGYRIASKWMKEEIIKRNG